MEKHNTNDWKCTIMSIIQAVITNEYAIIAGDRRAVIEKEGKILNHFNKIIKLNNQVMFGCTGGTLDNFQLFDGYCYYNTRNGYENTDHDINITYNEFIETITARFNEMYNLHINGSKRYDLGSIVCGFNGCEFEITALSIGSRLGSPDGIFKAHKAQNFPYKIATAGLQKHNDLLVSLAQKHYYEYKKQLTILQWKNIIKETIETGVDYDDTINSEVNFEIIRKIEKDGDIFFK